MARVWGQTWSVLGLFRGTSTVLQQPKCFFAMIVFECKFVSFTKESLLRRFLVVLSMATPLHYGKRLIRKKIPHSCQEWGKSLGQLQYPHLDHFSQEADARFPSTWWNWTCCYSLVCVSCLKPVLKVSALSSCRFWDERALSVDTENQIYQRTSSSGSARVNKTMNVEFKAILTCIETGWHWKGPWNTFMECSQNPFP